MVHCGGSSRRLQIAQSCHQAVDMALCAAQRLCRRIGVLVRRTQAGGKVQAGSKWCRVTPSS